jgi:hypothetical protein
MARKSGFVRRNGVMRRETLWSGALPTSTTLASANSAALVFTLGASILTLAPFTIVRTRGMVSVTTDQVAQTESYQIAITEAVVSELPTRGNPRTTPTG